MPLTEHVLIVGGGQAAAEVSALLRMQGHAGAITIVGDERHPPYQRPPLSKVYLAGDMAREKLSIRPPRTYETAAIEVHLGARVERIDRGAHRAELSDGRRLPYDKLVLATGGRARRLVIPGAERAYAADNVYELRTIDDAERLRSRFARGRRLVIVGGGYIGLEVAAAAIGHGLHVTVLEALPRVLARVTAPIVSTFYEQVHRAAGVDVRVGTAVAGFTFGSDGAVATVICANGSRIAADLVLIGIGLVPNTELAAAAGLAVADGIVVDQHSRTDDPDVYAAGDCTSFPCAHAGARVRLESVPNALEQARCVAASITGGERAYTAIPWFWSDQYDLKLQMVGLSGGHDRVLVRGDPAQRSFLALYFRGDRLIAADAVARPQEFSRLRRLIALDAPLDPEAISDDRLPLPTAMPARA